MWFFFLTSGVSSCRLWQHSSFCSQSTVISYLFRLSNPIKNGVFAMKMSTFSVVKMFPERRIRIFSDPTDCRESFWRRLVPFDRVVFKFGFVKWQYQFFCCSTITVIWAPASKHVPFHWLWLVMLNIDRRVEELSYTVWISGIEKEHFFVLETASM